MRPDEYLHHQIDLKKAEKFAVKLKTFTLMFVFVKDPISRASVHVCSEMQSITAELAPSVRKISSGFDGKPSLAEIPFATTWRRSLAP